MTAVTALGIVASSLSVIAFLPQVIKALRTRSTGDVSIGMFMLILAGAALWIAYGWLRRDWPVVGTNAVIAVLATIMILIKRRYG